MIHELLQAYDAGAITAHHLALESLRLLDPAEPELVLALLPDAVLIEMETYVKSYVPNGMKTNFGAVPTNDHVIAAANWIHERQPNLTPSE